MSNDWEPPMPDDWARQTAEKIQKATQEQNQRDEFELQRRNLLKAQMPHMWSLLRNKLVQKAAAVNKQLDEQYFQVVDSTVIEADNILIKSPKGELEVALFDSFSRITINRIINKGPLSKPEKEAEQGFRFEVVNGEVWLQTEADKVNHSIDDVAQSILEKLI